MVLKLRFVFCADLRTDSDFCFYTTITEFFGGGGTTEVECLLRGTR